MVRRIAAVVLIAWLAPCAVAQRLAIGQIDTGQLLFGQRVGLYLSIDLPGDAAPDPGALRVYESADGRVYHEVDAVFDLVPVRSLNAPLSFYMLVDNSGSMYDEYVPGRPELRRIDAARSAIRDFANSVTHERDRLGLALFGTRYLQLLPPGPDIARLGPVLDAIERPPRAEGYTELYAALIESAADARSAGRRTVVVLSDGENYPYSIYEREPHPEYGDRLFTHEEAIEAFQREGLSVFAIHYGDDREDPNLGLIAEQTGGRVYRAIEPDELAQLYQDIRSAMLAEYRLTYRATMLPAERRYVRVTYRDDRVDLRAERPYFASTLFAGHASPSPVVYVVFLVAGLAGLAVLLTLSIRAGSRSTSLVLLDSGGAHALARTVALGSGDTVIGASPDADLTIAGSPGVTERHAVVSYEPRRGEYTIVSEAPVRVNNKLVTRRVLKPGDVINIEGTVFAFDEPAEESGETDDAPRGSGPQDAPGDG